MAKNKQAKKKERERRVAQKKLAAAAQKREQEPTKNDLPKTFPGKSQLMTSAVPKVDHIPAVKKNSVTQRRSGG